MRIIRKYKNRLLYDTVTSRLITLRQLAELLRENGNVRIEDNESGKDITRLTLLQMLLDMEKSGRSLRSLVPDLMAGLFNLPLPDLVAGIFKLPRLDMLKVLKDLVQKNQEDQGLGRAWAQRLIHESSLASLVPSDREALVVEEIAERLNDLYGSILIALEGAIEERAGVLEKRPAPDPDALEKTPLPNQEREGL